MKLIKNSKHHQMNKYIGYVIVITIYFIFAFTAKLPILASESEKSTIMQTSSFASILFHLIIITVLYTLIIYFIPFKVLATQIKSYQQPLRTTMSIKFEYWLRSLLHEDELREEKHISEVSKYINERATAKIDILKKAAELNDMTTQTFIKLLEAQAHTNFINAKGETEKAHGKLLLEAINFIAKMSPMWQAYTITSIFGSTNANQSINDLDLKKEFAEILKKVKEEELRTMKNKNDYDEFLNKEKMNDD